MELNNLKYTKGSRNHKTKTYGRGFGSGIGKTSGKGTKGQKSRKSGHVRIGFEGGQTPIYRKIPKVGFNNVNFANQYYVVSLAQIAKLNEKKVDREVLLKARLIGNKKLPIKIIASNKVKLPEGLIVIADKYTLGAQKALKIKA